MEQKRIPTTLGTVLMEKEEPPVNKVNTPEKIDLLNHEHEDNFRENHSSQIDDKKPSNTLDGFKRSIDRIKNLKLDHKTKMEVGTETNKKVMMLSKILGVNGYALIDVAVNEFLERNKKEIDRVMKQAMK
jgi:hypothetical protein